MSTLSTMAERARNVLVAMAVGDALGAPTQSLPPELIRARYDGLVDRFFIAPADQPIAPGHRAGRITDDTEQALLLARLLLDDDGQIAPLRWAARLLDWEHSMRARGSADLLGPSTSTALAELAAGADPAHTGRRGNTNGAAMRIAPVAISAAPGPVLVSRVQAASTLTHATRQGLAAAGAVAFAISAGLDGADLTTAIAGALDGARLASRDGVWTAGAGVPERIAAALAVPVGEASAADWIADVVGTSLAANESVPAAFAVVVAAAGDPWRAVCLGASVGGDCDTIAALAGAMAAATSPARLPPDAVRTVLTVNPELADLDVLVAGLLELRAG